MDKKRVAFLPFHAVDAFMETDYRAQVLRAAFQAQRSLPAAAGRNLAALTKKYVWVPGFRDARKAPVNLRLRPAAKAFEKHADFAAAVLAAWAEAHAELRAQVHALLTTRGWEILPPEADRAKLPGFLPSWPRDENFETLTAAFREQYPESEASDDDISLMSVWIAGRLPYKREGEADSLEAAEAFPQA